MVEILTLTAYGLLILVPAIIMGFASMINSPRAGMVLAYLNIVSILSYFTYIDVIPQYVSFIFFTVLALLFAVGMRNIIGGRG